MRFKLSSLLTILLIVGSSDARPSKSGSPEVGKENVENSETGRSKGIADESSSERPNEPRSSSVVKSDSRTELKSLDQSLRTVATQLLNVTNPSNESKESIQNPNTSNEKMSNVLLIHKSNEKTSHVPGRFGVALVNDVVGFGRPVNSKFGYFESSHPGVAMALTEEELERELSSSSSTRLITAHKNHPTTPGGISTWVLMQSPTTTDKPSIKIQLLQEQTEAKTTFTLDKMASVSTTPIMERITTLTKSTTPSVKKTTARPITTAETFSNSEKSKTESTTVSVTTPKTTTIKISTVRPKLSTSPKPVDTTKMMSARPSSVQSIKPKVSPTRKPATKSPVETTKHPSTSKIEKVTFRPVTMITTPKSNDIQKHVVEKPIFLTKLKASITNANPIEAASITTNNNATIPTKQSEPKFPDPENSPAVPTKIKKPNKTSNVLKVQLKKPTESPTNIEIEAIKVNAPVLRIEKIEPKQESKQVSSKRNVTRTAAAAAVPALIPENSRIDLQFNFNPEIKKVETAESSSATESIVTTTKRPHKRKKNKLRRRRPATSPATTTTTTTTTTSLGTTVAAPTERSDVPTTELGIMDNAIQESKIDPESKVSGDSGTGIKTNKKKQVQKPIGTQIYNFLSREVMPSFGVMSLVGLGLGLASYFLYPFGGAIARRNYVVEPNYKYNMEEYGGNYGQSEEEVFSKVLQGMTNNDGKYGGIKDYETNFYRYQQPYDHSRPDIGKPTTRRIPEASKYTTDQAAAVYHRPIAMTTRTDFNKYPQFSTTSNYYERQKKPDFEVGQKSADRQFVVGNIPKEYSHDNVESSHQDNYKFLRNAEALKSTGDTTTTTTTDYEEIEITPSAVQVEHGPRSLIELDAPKHERKKRDSVIQLIPSRTEIEKEEKDIQTEEPLSNEILDIIDSVIPPDAPRRTNDDKDEKNKVYGLDSESSVVAGNTERSTAVIGSKKIAVRIEATRRTNLAVEKNEEKIAAAATMREETTEETVSKSEITSSQVFDSDSTTDPSSTISSTTVPSLSIDEILGTTGETDEPQESQETTEKPNEQRFNIFSFVKKIAEVKLRLGVAILKHASEGFARYLGHVQKRINGEEQ